MTKMEKYLAVAAQYRAVLAAVKAQEKKMVTIPGDRMTGLFIGDRGFFPKANTRYANMKYRRLRDELRKLEKQVAAAGVAAAKVAPSAA